MSAALCWMAAGSRLTAESQAVLIGISVYEHSGHKWLKWAHRDADEFAKEVAERFNIRKDAIKTLVDKEATRTAVLRDLEKAAKEVRANDTLYIFISGRGRTVPGMNDGLIDTHESAEDKAQAAAVLISEIKKILQARTPMGRILLFADLCREAGSSASSNRIHAKLRVLRELQHPLAAFLATEPERRSFESDTLGGGHGFFGYYLMDGILKAVDQKGDGKINASDIDLFLKDEIRRETNHAQRPTRFANERLKDAEIVRTATRKVAIRAPQFERTVLLASFGAPPQSAVISRDAGDEEEPKLDPEIRGLRQKFQEALRKGVLLGEEGAVRFYKQAAPSMPEPMRENDVADLIAALEDIGQQVIARYGAQDVFAGGDPQWDELLLSQADYERCARNLEEAANLTSNTSTKFYRQARQLFCEGQAAFLSKDPVTAEARFRAAVTAEANYFRAEVTAVPAKASKLLKAFAEPHNGLGLVNLARLDYETATHHFRTALEKSSRWAYPRHNLALALIGHGDYEAAVGEYRAAIEAAPYYPYLYYSLAALLQRMQRDDEAEIEYRNAEKVFLQQAKEFDARAEVWKKRGDSAEEKRARAVAAVFRKNIGEVFTGQGVLAESRGHTNEARTLYEMALDAYPGLVPAAHNLALVHVSEGRLQDGISLLRANVNKEREFAPSRLALAEALLQKGSAKEASAEFEYLYDKQPDSAVVVAGLAQSLMDENRGDDALKLLRKAIAGPAAGPVVREALADVYRRSNQEGMACEEFKRALREAERAGYSQILARLRWKARSCP